MRKTENRRKKVQMPAGIRQKMMAAVSMLMVSCIMLVSSTYAWFTLSTAPEVTGITTNVGANGNLEMMLLTGSKDGTTKDGSFYSTADDLGVVSQVGDSMAVKEATVSNVTWGNLVDLSHDSYGLGNIVLAPARLNLVTTTTVGTTILNAPSYGSDGRVVDVNTATYTGKFDGTKFAYDDVYKGVRVLGTTTDVSQRLASYRTAKGNITVNINAAKNSATASLKNNGQDLANILMKYVADENVKFTFGDLRALYTVLSAIENATENTAVAIKNAVIAHSLSGENKDASGNVVEITDTEVTNLVTQVSAVTDLTAENLTAAHTNVILPANLGAALTVYDSLNTHISSAMDALTGTKGLAPGLTLENTDVYADAAGEFSYTQISNILNFILDKSYVKVGGQQNPGKANLSAIMKDYIDKQSIIIEMLDDSGVYAEIAELVGNYTASGFDVSVQHEMLGDEPVDVPVTMKTTVAVDKLIGSITFGAAPTDTTQAANSTLSNTYGYALDFGFRTNAAASNLLLQTAGVNRVYSDEKNKELNTQGAGSYMEFSSSEINTFTADDVLALMSAIRVAFVVPSSDETAELLAIGALDITATTNQQTGITTYAAGTGGTTELLASGNGYKSGLFLYDYTVDADKCIELTNRLEDQSSIMPLTQNKAAKITVVVYLDGDIVDNTMVANANQSMTGKLNLQFSSSATLAPMENTGMRDGGSTGTAITYTEAAKENTKYTVYGYTGTVKPGYTIYKGSNNVAYYKYTGDTNYTKLTANNISTVVTIEITPVTEIKLNKNELTLEVDGTETLTATVNADATVKTVTWKSSNIAVATVDETGKVTAVASGTAKITATSGDESATCSVTVNAASTGGETPAP